MSALSTRFSLLLAGLLLVGPAAMSAAAEDLTVLRADDRDAPPRKMLNAYLQARANEHFDARRAAVAALKTPDDVQRRQRELRAKFVEALGGFPDKTPLNPQVVGRAQ